MNKKEMRKNGINRHHTCFTRKDWQESRIGFYVRSSHGMIVPMLIEDHRELHREVEPPKAISPQLGGIVLHNIVELSDNNYRLPERLVVFDGITALLRRIGEIDKRHYAPEALDLAVNFEQQRLFIKDEL